MTSPSAVFRSSCQYRHHPRRELGGAGRSQLWLPAGVYITSTTTGWAGPALIQLSAAEGPSTSYRHC